MVAAIVTRPRFRVKYVAVRVVPEGDRATRQTASAGVTMGVVMRAGAVPWMITSNVLCSRTATVGRLSMSVSVNFAGCPAETEWQADGDG
jgi:hypothetical protein